LPTELEELNPPARILLGPGPSNVHPRVMRAMLAPVLGHLDPDFIRIMEQLKARLRALFRTSNELTFPVSGTGSAGMECAIANLIEDGDEAVVGVNGVFGGRLADCAERHGARVIRVEAQWGQIIEPAAVRAALTATTKPKLVAIVHAETSTGIHQPVDEIARLAHEHGALFVLDTVTSLGCVPVELDAWGIDASFSCTQKGIGAPPGLAPVSFSHAARAAVRARRSKCKSWYLDLAMIEQYWGDSRVYHHTAPISMNYALHEALRIILEEGLEARFARHRLNAAALVAGLSAMGLEPAAAAGYRLPQLTAVRVPTGVDEAAVRGYLLSEFNIEIGAGLGPLRGKIWRIGLMGESSRRENVFTVLSALEAAIVRGGHEVSRGAALAAADKVYSAAH
jgi:alanine-glyoxylate transaminase/serine-glyoxylate transaminase/serine-pyruvate transaminase